MNTTATSSTVRVSTRKVRLVADSIRNMPVQKALASLRLVNKHGAQPVIKTLQSAIANAVNNGKMAEDKLFVTQVMVNEGPFLKRFKASTRGRIHPYKKRTSHITIAVGEKGGKN